MDYKNAKRSEKEEMYEFLKKGLNSRLKNTKKKVIHAKYMPVVEQLNKVIKENKKQSVVNRSLFDHPFLTKKQLRSQSTLNNCKTNSNAPQVDHSIHQASRNYHPSQGRINSNFSLKHHVTDDLWELQNEHRLTQTMKDIGKHSQFYEREKFLQKKKEIEIEKMRNHLREEELKTLKDGPQMSKTSVMIIKSLKKQDFKPIHKRIYLEQEKKINSMNEIRKELEEEAAKCKKFN